MADDNSEVRERTVGEWTAYQHDDGGTYYHNEETGESSWDAPPGFDEGGGRGDHIGRGDDDGVIRSTALNEGADADAAEDGITRSPPMDGSAARGGDGAEREVADGEEIGDGWVAYKDSGNEGLLYYYNTETRETQWERPNVRGGEVAAGEGGADRARGPAAEAIGDEGVSSLAGDGERSPPPPEESAEVESPKAKDRWPADDEKPTEAELTEQEPKNTAETAEQFLQNPDAVMEPDVFDHITIMVKELGVKVGGTKVKPSLINGYGGDTIICGLLGLWLAELKSRDRTTSFEAAAGTGGDSSVIRAGASMNQTLFREGADASRNIAEQVLIRLAKERFTKEGGDAIVKLSKKEMAFIDRMIKSDRWRTLLIDLSATNRDSPLFMYCLQYISDLGYHRAIANRINQSDYFGVFNSMLASELSIAARISVDGYVNDVIKSIDMDKGPMGGLIKDLRRTCTSTSYTYLYAMQVLSELISKSNESLSTPGGVSSRAGGLKQAVRKWERLREELEDEMLMPLKTGTIFQRKRRIEAALAMSDLFQRKRRRAGGRMSEVAKNGNGNTVSSSGKDLADTLDLALSQLLMRNSLGEQISKETAEGMLKYAYGGSTDRIGDLLIKHPSAITALLHNLFGQKRIRLLETRLQCARLLAYAVTASERQARLESAKAEINESDEDSLTKVILNASQLCEQLENTVSFTVLDKIQWGKNSENDSSLGRQLSAICIDHPVVSQGALVWAKEFASGSDFVAAVSYPTISPCIMSLAGLISRYHPLTRPAVLEISLIFMGQSNREISHRKMQSIKEQCIRLMLQLSTQGLSLAVVSAVRSSLNGDGSSEMDSALVRYFFVGMLEVSRPPFSLAFARALGGLMASKPCLDALSSKHFEEEKRPRMIKLIHQFEAAIHAQAGLSWEEDRLVEDKRLISMLKAMYCKHHR